MTVDQDTAERQCVGKMESMENGRSMFSKLSATVRAVVRIRHKYQTLKRRQLGRAASAAQPVACPSTSPKIFTFEPLDPEHPPNMCKKKKRKKTRVLFPDTKRRIVPTKEPSRAKHCLVLLSVIVSLQVYNAFENLDDHVIKYDLEGLEKTLKREVFGQQKATEGLLEHLRDFLSTYVHNKPLVLSLLGPSGVGKSHIGRLLTHHFRSVVGEQLVMQYFALHHCPTEGDVPLCSQVLTTQVSKMVTQAEEEEKIPLFVFDEMEHMPTTLLDTLLGLVQNQDDNEYLNAIYIFISNLGHEEITKFVLQNSSSAGVAGRGYRSQELNVLIHQNLVQHHVLWTEAELLPLTLLEKSHVIKCFIDEMSREGFYPERSHVERLAEELGYYSVGEREFSRAGCKQVVAKVNLL